MTYRYRIGNSLFLIKFWNKNWPLTQQDQSQTKLDECVGFFIEIGDDKITRNRKKSDSTDETILGREEPTS